MEFMKAPTSIGKRNYNKVFSVLHILILSLLIAFLSQNIEAQTTFTANATGNWNAPATWTKVGGSTSTYPGEFAGQNDQVIVANNRTVTLNLAINTNSVTILNLNGANAILNMGANTLVLTGATANVIGTGRVNISTGTLTIGGNATVSNIACTGAATINIAGNWALGTAFTRSTSTVNFTSATAGQTIGGVAAATNFYNLTINKAGQVATLTAGITVNGALNVAAGTLNASTFIITGTPAGAFIVGANAIYRTARTATPWFPTLMPTLTLNPTSTVDYYANASFTIPAIPVTYGNLTISTGGVKTLAASNNIAGNLTINAGTLADGGFTPTIGGNIINNGFHTGAGRLILSGGAANHQISGIGTFVNIELNDAFGATLLSNYTSTGTLLISSGELKTSGLNVSVTGTTTVSGTLNIDVAGGTNTFGNLLINGTWLNSVDANVSIGGNLTNNATVFTAGNGTYTFTGAARIISGTAASTNIPNVTIPTGGTQTNNLANFAITTLNITGTGTLANTGTMSIGTVATASTFTNNGTVTVTTSLSGAGSFIQGNNSIVNIGGTNTVTTFTLTGNPNTVAYVGTAPQTTRIANYNNLTINNSGQTATLGGITNVSGILTISAGGTLNASSFNLTVLGASNIGGTFSDNLIGGTNAFGDITLTSTGVWTNAGASPIAVSGNLSVATGATFTSSAANYTFSGAGKSIGGTIAALSITNLAITGTLANSIANLTVGTITVTNPGTFTNNAIVTTTGATSVTGTGTFIQGPSALLTLGGTINITTLTANAIGNTVSYSCSTAPQTIVNVAYANLDIASSAQIVSIGAPLAVSGNLSITSGIFNSNAFATTVNGNIASAGTHNGTGAITLTGGSTSHQISCTGTGFFRNITLNDATRNANLSQNVQINGTLTLSNGYILLGNNNLTLTTTASLAGVFNATNMIVTDGTGELRKTFGVAAGQTFTFPLGDISGLTEYSPFVISTLDVATSDYIGVRVTNSKHTNNNSVSEYISRYWSFSNGPALVFSGATLNCTYLDADITALETDMYIGIWDGATMTKSLIATAASNSLSLNGISSFSSPYELTGIDGKAPALTVVTITSNNPNVSCVKIGNLVTIAITSDESLQTPVVTLGGLPASVSGSGNSWTATRLLNGGEPEIQLVINIAYSDLSGNAGIAYNSNVGTNASFVIFDKTAPTPVGIENTVFPAPDKSQLSGSIFAIGTTGSINDEIWLAPVGTSTFVAGTNMTKTSGTAGTIAAPADNGVYYCYVLDCAGNATVASTAKLFVFSGTAPIYISTPSTIAYTGISYVYDIVVVDDVPASLSIITVTPVGAYGGTLSNTSQGIAKLTWTPAAAGSFPFVLSINDGTNTITQNFSVVVHNTINVPANQPTIQAAINASVNGDMVVVSAGTYFENINFNGKVIEVRGDPSTPANVIIDGGGLGAVVTFQSGEAGMTSLNGFTIQNGVAKSGLASSFSNHAPVTAKFGGGIFCYQSSPLLKNLIIQNNTAPILNGFGGSGSGIYIGNNSHVTIEGPNTIIRNNTTQIYRGGGICIDNSTLTINGLVPGGVSITNNTGGNYGGGIASFLSTLNLTDISITGNSVNGPNATGGGIYSIGSVLNYVPANVNANSSTRYDSDVFFK